MASPATVLFVAREDDGPILGSLTLALFRIPTGLRAWIEDVVVDEAARGKGVGAALNEAALDHARAGRRPHRRPDQPPLPRGGQPPLPAPRLRRARDQRLPLRPLI